MSDPSQRTPNFLFHYKCLAFTPVVLYLAEPSLILIANLFLICMKYFPVNVMQTIINQSYIESSIREYSYLKIVHFLSYILIIVVQILNIIMGTAYKSISDCHSYCCNVNLCCILIDLVDITAISGWYGDIFQNI